MKKLKLSKANTIATALSFLSFAIIATTIYLIINVKVLEDWKLSISASEVHVGDTVVLESTYNKVRDASGESIRYITCKNRSGTMIRYELSRATSDRAKGRGGTGIPLVVRRDIADLPTTCRFEIAIHYDGVLPFKKVNVYNQTKFFTLLPEEDNTTIDRESALQVTTQSSQSPVRSVSPASSSSNTSPSVAVPQSTIVQQQPPSTSTTNTINNTNVPEQDDLEQGCSLSVLGLINLCL